MAQAWPPRAPVMAAPFGTAGHTSMKVRGGTDEEIINPTTRNKKFTSIFTFSRKPLLSQPFNSVCHWKITYKQTFDSFGSIHQDDLSKHRVKIIFLLQDLSCVAMCFYFTFLVRAIRLVVKIDVLPRPHVFHPKKGILIYCTKLTLQTDINRLQLSYEVCCFATFYWPQL